MKSRPRRPGYMAERPGVADHEARTFPTIVELVVPPAAAARHQAGLAAVGTKFRTHRNYRMGAITIILTREFGRWHMSVAHPARAPTWAEIAHAWYAIVPEAAVMTAALILPPKSEYVNIHKYCFQVFEIDPLPESDPT